MIQWYCLGEPVFKSSLPPWLWILNYEKKMQIIFRLKKIKQLVQQARTNDQKIRL